MTKHREMPAKIAPSPTSRLRKPASKTPHPPAAVATEFISPTPVERNSGGTTSHCVGLSFELARPRINENSEIPIATTTKLGFPRNSRRQGAPIK